MLTQQGSASRDPNESGSLASVLERRPAWFLIGETNQSDACQRDDGFPFRSRRFMQVISG